MNQSSYKSLTSSLNSLLEHKKAQGITAKIMLTGGKSAEKVYKKWKELGIFKSNMASVDFFLTDERCVSPCNIDSNFYLINKSLFSDHLPCDVNFNFIKGDAADLQYEADRYGKLLPDVIDFMVLSMGEDGHIASLFPNSFALKETKKKIVEIYGPKKPNHRMTITPKVIKNAKNIFVLALGDKKRKMYEQALSKPDDIETIPSRLVLNSKWIFNLDDEES